MNNKRGYGDFILVSEVFHFGLCIERTEYYYEFRNTELRLYCSSVIFLLFDLSRNLKWYD